MGISAIVVQPVGEGNFEASIQFLIKRVGGGEAEVRRYLADGADS